MKKIIQTLLLSIFFISCTKATTLFTQEEMNSLSRTTIQTSTNDEIFLITEYLRDDFLKRAIVFEKTKNTTIFFEISDKIIKDGKGTVIIDGSSFGKDFYAWKVEIVKNGIYFHPFWNNGKKTTDPIMFTFNPKLKIFEKFKVNESEY